MYEPDTYNFTHAIKTAWVKLILFEQIALWTKILELMCFLNSLEQALTQATSENKFSKLTSEATSKKLFYKTQFFFVTIPVPHLLKEVLDWKISIAEPLNSSSISVEWKLKTLF